MSVKSSVPRSPRMPPVKQPAITGLAISCLARYCPMGEAGIKKEDYASVL